MKIDQRRMFLGLGILFLVLVIGINTVFFWASQRQINAVSERLGSLEKQMGISDAENKGMRDSSYTFIEDSQVIDTVKRIEPSVVSITATKEVSARRQGLSLPDPFFQEFFGDQVPAPAPGAEKPQKVQVSGGSGFVYSSDGLIMTNKHVVDDSESEYTVTFADGSEYPAEVVARDVFNDVAVVKIVPKEGENLPALLPLEFGDSDMLQVGQQVIAIGNPLEFQNTVTTGIISGLGRDILASGGRNSERLQGLLQTDAAINFGNSGGPLVNLAGQVIGMNTAIASGAEGIGFAIPSNDLKKIAESVQKHGRIVRPFLGVQYVILNEATAQKFNLDITEGALLVGDADSGLAVVRNSPAAKAGLREGDVLVSIDGEKITTENDLRQIIMKKEVGQEIGLVIRRDTRTENIKVTLEEMK